MFAAAEVEGGEFAVEVYEGCWRGAVRVLSEFELVVISCSVFLCVSWHGVARSETVASGDLLVEGEKRGKTKSGVEMDGVAG